MALTFALSKPATSSARPLQLGPSRPWTSPLCSYRQAVNFGFVWVPECATAWLVQLEGWAIASASTLVAWQRLQRSRCKAGPGLRHKMLDFLDK